jgi:hypothetical protein
LCFCGGTGFDGGVGGCCDGVVGFGGILAGGVGDGYVVGSDGVGSVGCVVGRAGGVFD